MAAGIKTGGRQKGVPNRRTHEIAEKLEALGCDPTAVMASIVLYANNPPELCGRMFSELAQYVFPKRKAAEYSGDIQRNYVMFMPEKCETTKEWTKRYEPTPQ